VATFKKQLSGNWRVQVRRKGRYLGIEELHFHDLRHEGTSRLFEAGFDIPKVALVTGHKDWRMLRRYTNLRPEHLKLVVFAPRRQQMFLAKGESSNSAVFEAAMELVVEDPSLDGAPRFRGTQIGGLEFTSLRTYWREEPPKRCCWRNFRGYRRRCSRRLGSTWPFDLEVLSAGRLRLVLQADGLHQAERRRLPQPYPRIFRVQRAKVGVEGSNHFTLSV